jgi:adenylate kinase family enzyme
MSFAYNHLHILGASGSGTTTLASSLSKELQYTHFDSDDYFWKTKFTEPRPRDERLQKLS